MMVRGATTNNWAPASRRYRVEPTTKKEEEKMILLSQEKLHEKQIELNQGKEVSDPAFYLWECGPIEQGALLETLCPRAEFICIMMLSEECVNEAGHAQYERVCGSYFALVQRQFPMGQ